MVLSPPQRSLCVVGRLGREKKKARRTQWELGQREKRGLRLLPFFSSQRPPRAFYFSIIAILIGIPSGSLFRGESQWFKTHEKANLRGYCCFVFSFVLKSLFSASTQNTPVELWWRYLQTNFTIDCEQSLFFFRFSESKNPFVPLLSRAISHARGHLCVSRLLDGPQKKERLLVV